MFHYPVKKSDLLVGNQEGYFKVNAALAEFQTYIAKLCEELYQYSNETLQEYGIERIEAFRYRIEKSGERLCIHYEETLGTKYCNVDHLRANNAPISILTNGAISSSSRAFEFTVRHKSSRYGFPHSEISFSSQEKDIYREIVGDYIQLAAPYPKMKTQYDEEKGYYDIVYKPETEKPTEKYENGVKVWTNPDGTPVQQEYHLSTTHKSIEDALADITKKTEAFKAIFEQKLELLRRVDIKQEKQKKKTMPKDEFLVKYLYKGGLF